MRQEGPCHVVNDTSTVFRSRFRPTQRGGYSAELENFLTTSSTLLGERSNFGGLVASIERGGSGGCSGTKGVGMLRIEPFENWDGRFFEKVHQSFGRYSLCNVTWKRLGLRHQWRLSARYCYSREKLPHGLHGQLGDLSVVAFVIALESDDPAASVEKLFRGAAKRGGLKSVEQTAARQLEISHRVWTVERAHVDTLVATSGVTDPDELERLLVDSRAAGAKGASR